jgi:hypothetical protein
MLTTIDGQSVRPPETFRRHFGRHSTPSSDSAMRKAIATSAASPLAAA